MRTDNPDFRVLDKDSQLPWPDTGILDIEGLPGSSDCSFFLLRTPTPTKFFWYGW